MDKKAPWHDPSNIPGPGMVDWLEENKKHVPVKLLHGSFVSDVLIPNPGKDATDYGVVCKMIDGTPAIFNPEKNCYEFGNQCVALLCNHFNPNTDSKEIKKVYETLDMVLGDTPELQITSNPNYISFSNGLLDVQKYRETGSVEQSLIKGEELYKYGTKYSLNWEIKDESELDHEALEFVKNWVEILKGHSQEDVEQMWIIFGSLLWAKNEKNAQAVVCYSDGMSGKSVIDQFLYDTVFPKGAVSYVRVHDHCDDTKVINLMNSIVNIDPDCDDSMVSSAAFARLKCCITGDIIQARQVYTASEHFEPTCSYLISTNAPLRFSFKSDTVALSRRMVYSAFPQTFDENNPETDIHIEEKLRRPEVVEAFLKLALDGLVKWLENGKQIPETEAGREIAEFFKASNNSVRQWMAEFDINADCLVNPKEYTIFIDAKIGIMDPYEHYLAWCKEMNISKPVAKTGFSRFLQKQFKNIETGGRRTIRPGKTVSTFKYKNEATVYDPNSDKGKRPIRIEELEFIANQKRNQCVFDYVRAYRDALRHNAEVLEKKNDKFIEDALTLEFLDLDNVVPVTEEVKDTPPIPVPYDPFNF